MRILKHRYNGCINHRSPTSTAGHPKRRSQILRNNRRTNILRLYPWRFHILGYSGRRSLPASQIGASRTDLGRYGGFSRSTWPGILGCLKSWTAWRVIGYGRGGNTAVDGIAVGG